MIVIGNKSYEVLKDHRNGWNLEAFRERYSEVLDRYDYIVGDWGYNQLRLKGFYRDNHPKAAKDSTFSSMSDYINEYCNFGCAHFVLQKTKEQKDSKEHANSKEPVEIRETPPKETKGEGEVKGSKETPQEGPKPGKEHKDQRERREAKESRREPRDPKESKEKEAKPSKEPNPPAEQPQ
ncbi:YutD family protein [Paenibacillus lautus]|uniref:YutD family protein n=1 Tax=Paenibacillus lautus TaxID=1401 RepID=UPI000FD926FF|nr:YutD family protein [Paenibacillus lautus]